jgi:phosphoglycerate dehydrogenase-like enzyme
MKKLLILMPQHFMDEVLPMVIKELPHLEIEWIAISDRDFHVETDILRTANFILYTEMMITREMLETAENLRLVQKWGSGTDGVDLDSAKRLGVPVANVPGGNATSVAEHCFGLMLVLYRRLCQANADLHKGLWNQVQLMSEGLEELSGKVLGIIGFGNIGRAVAQRAVAFEMKVRYYCRHQLKNIHEAQLSVEYSDLDQITITSDIIVLAVPLSLETTHLYDRLMFNKMKPTAILINVSRGGVVNETDLYEALVTKRIAGAGLDVFEHEHPRANNRLFRLPNVVVTPHVAGRTRQALNFITESCVNNIALVAQGELPRNIVSN